MGDTIYTTTAGKTIEDMLFIDKAIFMKGGPGLFLDDDGDTGIRALTPNTLEVLVQGAVDWTFTPNELLMDQDSYIKGNGDTIAAFAPIAAVNELSGPGAMDIAAEQTLWTTTGQDAGTMVDGAAVGQSHEVVCVSYGGNGTLAPTSFGQLTNIVFGAVGQYVKLRWNGTDWIVVRKGNYNDGTTLPTIN